MGTLRSYIFFKCVTVRYFSNNINQPIMKYLNVAEKNDAAKNIASLLSRGNSNRVRLLEHNYILQLINVSREKVYLNSIRYMSLMPLCLEHRLEWL